MKKHIKKLIPVLSVLPFLLGTAGYIITGEKVSDAMYASFALYFVNPVSDAYNILIETARWTSALVTTTAVVYAVRSLWLKIIDRIKCISRDSVAVYSEPGVEIAFDRKTKAMYAERSIKPRAASHIIMLGSDTESLQFYREHSVKLKGKPVYIGLRELEYGMTDAFDDVTFFDFNGSVARVLWKSVKLWSRGKNRLTITVYGSGALAGNIINYALLLNIFSEEQQITYILAGDNENYRIRHEDMPTGNADRVLYYESGSAELWDVMKTSDIIIIADELPADLFQTIFTVCRGSEIYYYSPKAGDIGGCLKSRALHSFGSEGEILTDSNIRQDALIAKGKELNLQYALANNGETDWNRLDGFTKMSNISSADYMDVLRELIQSGINTDVEKLAVLEHIRWCRFHYLNGWKYGIPENGRNKDPEMRIHKCLVDYSELTDDDKEKDAAIINNIINEINEPCGLNSGEN